MTDRHSPRWWERRFPDWDDPSPSSVVRDSDASPRTKISSDPRLPREKQYVYYLYVAFVLVVFAVMVAEWWKVVVFGGFIAGLIYLNYMRERGLAEEVFDDGDSLLVRFRGEEERIPFWNIKDADAYNVRGNPGVSLKLVRPCKFGSAVSFVPTTTRVSRWTLDPFWMDPIVDDLLARSEKARANAGVRVPLSPVDKVILSLEERSSFLKWIGDIFSNDPDRVLRASPWTHRPK